MAASFNKVYLIGNLTRDPELRYVPSGSAVANFSIAVNRTYTTQAGEKKEDVCFVRVVTWARLAEVCGEYLNKGRSVFVEGRLQNRTWETEDGQKRTTLEVIADSVQFLDKKATGSVPPLSSYESDSSSASVPDANVPNMGSPEQPAMMDVNTVSNEEQLPF